MTIKMTLMMLASALSLNAFAAEKMVTVSCASALGRYKVEVALLPSYGDSDLKITDTSRSQIITLNSKDNEFFAILRNTEGTLAARDGSRPFPNDVMFKLDTVTMKGALRHESFESGNPIEMTCSYAIAK